MFLILLSIPFIVMAGYLAYKRPVWSIALILLLLPTFLIHWNQIGLPVNTLDLLIAVSAGIWAVTHFTDIKEGIKKHKAIILILELWLISASTSLFFSPDPVAALGILKSYFLLPIIFILQILFIVKTKNEIRILIWSLMLLVLYNSIFGIMQYFYPSGILGFNTIPNPTWRNPLHFRVTGLLQYPNALALLIAPLLPLIATLFIFAEKRYTKYLITLSILFGIIAIVLAKSKGGILALISAVLFTLIYRYRKNIWYVLASILLLILLFVPYTDTIVSRFGLSSYSAQLRFTQWREAAYLISDNPIAGAGLTGYQSIVTKYHSIPFLEIFLYPHNIILNFWAELGIIGLLIALAMLFLSYKKNYQLSQKKPILALAGAASLTILITHGFVDVPYFKNDLAIIFLFVIIWPYMLFHLENDGPI